MPNVSFTGFAVYIAVRSGFDKQCLSFEKFHNAHNHNVYTFAPNRLCCAKNATLHY